MNTKNITQYLKKFAICLVIGIVILIYFCLVFWVSGKPLKFNSIFGALVIVFHVALIAPILLGFIKSN
jgi:phosphoglycerol transferase MdoB-like AlkP superfamily enzyme